MAQSPIIAKVSFIDGEAFARDSAGKLRQLKVGDVIRDGESVVTSNGSHVLLAMPDGREMSVQPGQVVRIDAEGASPIKPDTSDNAVAHHDKDTQTVAQVLAKGGSLDSLLDQDAPAAGAAATGENGGHSFVELQRVVESIASLTSLSMDAAAGRGSVVAASALVDTTPLGTPAAPTNYDDNVGAILNPTSTAPKTDDSTPGINIGTGLTDTPTLYVDGKAVAATYDPGTGTLTPSTPLVDGQHALTYTLTNPVSGESPQSGALNVTVDTTPLGTPAAPTNYDDNVGAILNPTSTAPKTDDSTPGINIGTGLTDTPTLYVDGKAVAATYDPGTGTLTPSTPLVDGQHALTYTLTNPVSGESPQSGALNLTVDVTGPAAPAITNAQDNAGPLTGSVVSGGATDDNTPTLSGTAPADAVSVTVYNGLAVIGTAAVVNGTWSLTPSVALDDGAYHFTAVANDEAGNPSKASMAYDVTVSAGNPPAVPQITDMLDNVDAQTGTIQKSSVTNDATPELQGTAGPNLTISVYDGTKLLGTTTSDTNGNWSYTPGKALAEGSHDLTVTATNAVGQISPATGSYPFTVDTLAPSAPAFAADDNVGAVTGTIAANSTTDDSTPTLTGSGNAGDTIRVYDGATLIGSVTVQTNGTWSLTTPTLVDGPHSLTTTATDPAGNTSGTPSAALAFTVDTVTVGSPNIVKAIDNTPAQTGDLATGAATNDLTPELVGTGKAGQTITVYEGSTAVGSTTVKSDGTWSVTLGTQSEAAHHYTATQTNAAGVESSASNGFDLTVDITPPAVPSFTASDDVGTVQGLIAANSTTDDKQPTFAGTGTPNDTITVYDGATALGSVTVKSDGTWSLTPSSKLSEDTHNITTTATDPAGNESKHSAALTFTVDTTAPTIIISSTATSLDTGSTAVLTFTLSESSSNFTQGSILVTGGTLSNFSGSGTTYTATFTPDGTSVTGSVSVASSTFSDAAGNANADGADANNKVTFTQNVAPTDSAAVTASGNENDAAHTVNLLANTTDANGDTLSIGSVTYSVNGGTASTALPTGVTLTGSTLTVDTNNPVFDPLKVGETQTITASYTINDGHGGTVLQTATFTVTGVNDAPVITSTNFSQLANWQTQSVSGLYNTGESNSGVVLAQGSTDSHYQVVSQPTGGTVSNTVAAPYTSYWIASDADSAWIGGPVNVSAPAGTYKYQTSFSLAAAADPTSVTIAFDIATDDTLTDILVNGVSMGITASTTYKTLTHIVLTGASGAFHDGVNTITFVVNNQSIQGNNPTGLRIDNMTSSVSVNMGSTLSSLLPAGTAVTDVDHGSSVKGYAITNAAADAAGHHWQYSTDGGVTWVNMDSATTSAALLLAPTDLVRWTGSNGTYTPLSVVAVDDTATAAVHTTVDVTNTGGETPYSTVVTVINPLVAVSDEAVISVPNQSTFYYTTSGGQIGTFDPTTGAKTVICNSGVVFFDVAVTPSGKLYGIQADGDLYSINTTTGAATLIHTSNSGVTFRGLVSDPNGVLYAAGSDGKLYTINTTNAAATAVGSFGTNVTCDDLLYSNNTVYALTTSGTLLAFDLSTHNVSTVVTGLPADMYGIGRYADGTIYAVQAHGAVYTIDLVHGTATATGVTVSTTGDVYGTSSSVIDGVTATITGDVTPGTTGQDSDLNGSTFSVTGVAAGSTTGASGGLNTVIHGTYGDLVMQADGSYKYTVDGTLASTQAIEAASKAAHTTVYYYLDAGGNIGTMDPVTGTSKVIGATGHVFYDIAATPQGKLYGIMPDGHLYSINTSTATSTLIGNGAGVTAEFRGMVADSNGILHADSTTGDLYTIDATTGVATLEGKAAFGDNVTITDDLIYANNTVYALTSAGTLVGYDLTTHTHSTVISGLPADMYGLATDAATGAVYAFEYGGNVYTMDIVHGTWTNTGVNVGHTIYGASSGYSENISSSSLYGEDVFTYSVTDTDGNVSTTTLTVNVTDSYTSVVADNYGSNSLTGTANHTDVFKWTLADQGTAASPATDHVTNFSNASVGAGGDVLDLRDLLQGENHTTGTGNLTNYLHFSTTTSASGTDTVIDINPAGSTGSVTQHIVLSGVDLVTGVTGGDAAIISDLLNKGKLLTD
jgi:large repetitive protein